MDTNIVGLVGIFMRATYRLLYRRLVLPIFRGPRTDSHLIVLKRDVSVIGLIGTTPIDSPMQRVAPGHEKML